MEKKKGYIKITDRESESAKKERGRILQKALNELGGSETFILVTKRKMKNKTRMTIISSITPYDTLDYVDTLKEVSRIMIKSVLAYLKREQMWKEVSE